MYHAGVAAVLLSLLHGSTGAPSVAPAGAGGRPDRPVLPARVMTVDGALSRLLIHGDQLFVACFHGANVSVFDTRTRRPAHPPVYLDAREATGPSGQGGRRRTVSRCPPGDMVAANGKLFVGQLRLQRWSRPRSRGWLMP
jgi:hypothetical protein